MTERLVSSVQYLRGVGPARARALEKSGIRSVEDLLLYAPRRYVDRRQCRRLDTLQEGQTATVLAEVLTAHVTRGRRSRFVARISDGTGAASCVWFRAIPYVRGALRAGDLVVLSGKVGSWRGELQFAHPEFETVGSADDREGDEELLEETLHAGRLIPIYPLTADLRSVGLASRGLRRIVRTALDSVGTDLKETLTPEQLERHALPGIREAFEQLHFPADPGHAAAAHARLAYEEFFYMQLLLADRSRAVKQRRGHAFRTWGPLVRAYLEGLGFVLTGAQQRVLAEVFEDMGRARPMNRLLQGDVGSGKTVIAAAVMLTAVQSGMQAALMAPTEILAEQHAGYLREQFARLDVPVHLLSSRLGSGERKILLQALAGDRPLIVIGTHALIQADVDFARLGAVVVDEQHRFGVLQRGALQAKGVDPDVLVMTATPIPRTLAMTLYGDLETSVIDEMPPGRRPVATHRVSLSRKEEVIGRVRKVLDSGAQVYWVFPLVEETEKSDLAAAVESYERLSGGPLADHRLGLVHGRLGSEEKERTMSLFRRGEIDLLVATTVIEVGVDVPGATMILIDHAERFGLSQLHQLRGRVGRGGGDSTCILLTGSNLTPEAESRLKAMVETTDGFAIAEADLEIRGPGEFFGTRQHGLPSLRIANLITDSRLLAAARTDAFAALGLGEDDARDRLGADPDRLALWRDAIARRLGERIVLADIA